MVQIVCPHCDRDNRLPRDWLRNAPPCVACGNALFEGRPVPLDDERRLDKLSANLPAAAGAMNLAQLLAWAHPHTDAVVTGPG